MERQDLRVKFLVFPLGKPHQKFLKWRSRELHIESGKRKVLMAYEGIAAAMALMRTIRPAWERVLARQPSILFSTLSKMGWKA